MTTTGYVILITLSVFDFLVRCFSISRIKDADSVSMAIVVNFLNFVVINSLLWGFAILYAESDSPCPQLEKVENVYKIK